MQHDLPVADRLAHVSEELEALDRVAVALQAVELAAGVSSLRLVHGDIGTLEQQLRLVAVMRIEGDPDARLDLEADLVELEPAGDSLDHLPAQVTGG